MIIAIWIPIFRWVTLGWSRFILNQWILSAAQPGDAACWTIPHGWASFTRPDKRLQKTMERSTIFNGKIHYFDWAMFNSKLLVYQRVFSQLWNLHLVRKCPIAKFDCPKVVHNSIAWSKVSKPVSVALAKIEVLSAAGIFRKIHRPQTVHQSQITLVLPRTEFHPWYRYSKNQIWYNRWNHVLEAPGINQPGLTLTSININPIITYLDLHSLHK